MIDRSISQDERELLAKTFKLFDFDKNGVIEKRDFEELAVRYAKSRGLDSDMPQTNPYYQKYLTMWNEIVKEVDGEFGSESPEGLYDGKITVDEWNRFWINKLKTGEAKDIAQLWTGIIFDLIDADDDGQINLQEYGNFLLTHELQTAGIIADELFQRIDINQDGVISKIELVNNIKLFFNHLQKKFE